MTCKKNTLVSKDVSSKEKIIGDEPDEIEIEGKSQEHEGNGQSEPTLLDKIKDLLSSKQMKSSKIASEFGVSKKEISKILYSNTDIFVKDIFFNWKLRK